MDALKKWLQSCLATCQGKLLLDNIGIDLEAFHINEPLVKSFAQGLSDAKVAASAPKLIPPTVEPFARAAAAVIERNALYLKGRKLPPPSAPLLSIFRFDVFQANLWFDFSAVGGLDEYAGPEAILDTLDALPDYREVLTTTATMRGGLEMAWLALAHEVNDAIVQVAVEDRPNYLRSGLGLLHFREESFLCCIEWQPTDVRVDELRRPCALDAGATLVFRSNEVAEDVGRTVDLASRKPMFSEIVSPPVPLRPQHRITRLGWITCAPSFDWTALTHTADDDRVQRTSDRILACGA